MLLLITQSRMLGKVIWRLLANKYLCLLYENSYYFEGIIENKDKTIIKKVILKNKT